MAKLLVEGDSTALEVITAALRSAGLAAIEVELAPRRWDVSPFPSVPGSWPLLAEVSPELAHADWRNEVLSLIDAADSGSMRPTSARPEPVVTTLRPAV